MKLGFVLKSHLFTWPGFEPVSATWPVIYFQWLIQLSGFATMQQQEASSNAAGTSSTPTSMLLHIPIRSKTSLFSPFTKRQTKPFFQFNLFFSFQRGESFCWQQTETPRYKIWDWRSYSLFCLYILFGFRSSRLNWIKSSVFFLQMMTMSCYKKMLLLMLI